MMLPPRRQRRRVGDMTDAATVVGTSTPESSSFFVLSPLAEVEVESEEEEEGA